MAARDNLDSCVILFDMDVWFSIWGCRGIGFEADGTAIFGFVGGNTMFEEGLEARIGSGRHRWRLHRSVVGGRRFGAGVEWIL